MVGCRRSPRSPSWRRALESDEKQSYWHYRLGRLLQTRGGGSPTAGLAELGQATTLEEAKQVKASWLTRAYYEYADALKNAGRNKDAVEWFNKYLTQEKSADSAFRKDAIKALAQLGAPWDRD